MNSMLFEIKDNNDNVHEIYMQGKEGIFTINDKKILEIMEPKGVKEIKSFFIKLDADNMMLSIKDYTLTDTIYIEGFGDAKSDISMFQSIGTNIHIVDQTIQHMQVDCANVFLAECNVKKIEIGLFTLVNRHASGENVTYQMDKVELRDVDAGTVDLYAECKNIIVQRSRIDEFNNIGSMVKNIVSKVERFIIWQNTNIGKLSMGNIIEKMEIEDTSINKMIARAKLYIAALEIKDSNIENVYGFEKSHFKNLSYDAWRWIGKSADNNRNVRERAEADYHMAKSLYKTEKGIDKFMSFLFDFCAGYGYKPFRLIRTSGLMVLLNTFIFSIIKLVAILSKECSIPLNKESLCKGVDIICNNLSISIAALAGQNSFTLKNGLPYWLSMIEYLLGVILFAMFVNALYARYKE